MNRIILLTFFLTASTSQASALLLAARIAARNSKIAMQNQIISSQKLSVHKIAANNQRDKDQQLHGAMSRLLEAQQEVIKALKNGANPMATIDQPDETTKILVYEFIKDDKSQIVAEEIYKAAGEFYTLCIADIAAHYNNDTFFLEALANGATLNCSGGFDSLGRTYFAANGKHASRGNLGKLILHTLDEEELNEQGRYGSISDILEQKGLLK